MKNKYSFKIVTVVPMLILIGCSNLQKNYKKESQLFDKLVSEINRVDGDGLIPRKNRPDNWNLVVKELRSDLQEAKSKPEIGQIFKRLDLSYPNIHSHITLSKEYDFHQLEGRVKFPLKMRYEEVSEKRLKKNIRIIVTDKEAFSELNKNIQPISGDEVVAINNRSVDDWHREVFNYCKYPLEKQCAVGFWDNFRKELYSWNRNIPLNLRLKRNDRIWDVEVPVSIPQNMKRRQSLSKNKKNKNCSDTRESYPNFSLVYEGYNACVYESKLLPSTVLLRIKSFNYRKQNKDEKIKHIGQETKFFWNKYWKTKAPKVDHLIIDVMNNMGGSSPVKWYELFFSNVFQEQYVKFKKIKEIDREDFRDALFYSENSKKNSFNKWVETGTYQNLSYGDFLPQMQQFCGDKKTECIKTKFSPRKNNFNGKVYIALDQWCHSSCVGFVWNMKNVLKDRVQFFGHPDDGDSTYGRIHLDGVIAQDDVRVESRPRVGGQYGSLGGNAILTQAVSVSRSTTSNGDVVSGIPQKVDHLIPLYWNDSWSGWEKRVITKAVEIIKKN